MSLLPVIKEDLEQYEEEDYEEASYSTSSRFSRNDFDYLLLPYYDENPFGINLQMLVVKCSMERTLRNLSSISWNIMLSKKR